MHMTIDNNMMNVAEFSIKAEGILSDEAVLSGFNYIFKSDENGNRTDVIEGIRYLLIDPITFGRFTVKVDSTKPIITAEALRDAEDPVYVVLPVADMVIKPYAVEYGKAKVTITAPYIKLATN